MHLFDSKGFPTDQPPSNTEIQKDKRCKMTGPVPFAPRPSREKMMVVGAVQRECDVARPKYVVEQNRLYRIFIPFETLSTSGRTDRRTDGDRLAADGADVPHFAASSSSQGGTNVEDPAPPAVWFAPSCGGGGRSKHERRGRAPSGRCGMLLFDSAGVRFGGLVVAASGEGIGEAAGFC
jgi:hypothetical protein